MMEIPIKIKVEKLPEFLQYLKSELNKLQGWRGNGQYEDGGIYVERLDVSIQTAQEELVPTTWTFTWNPDGSLDPIKVEANDTPSEAWRESVQGIIRNTLEATVNQSKQRFFRRDAFAYIGPNLDGEYWISGKRIAPAIPGDEIDYLSD